MQHSVAVLICVLSIFLASCATHSAARTEKRVEENAARAAALHWLQLLDKGDYEEAFKWEAPDFRVSRTQKQSVRFMQAHRASFGHTISRNFIGAANIHKMVGAPDGNYESIVFKTVFEHKSSAAERVILIKESNGWRVIDYRIY